MPAELFTIGHSTHDALHFLALLKQHGVTAVCDVRSTPYSRHNPQYNREQVSTALANHSIAYVFLGDELGARRVPPSCCVDGKTQFTKLAGEPLFRKGLDRVAHGARDYSVALMCAEKDPITCHRMILVARQLRSKFSIKHILEDGTVEDNAVAEKRLAESLKIHPDMIRNQSRCIEEAYDIQGQRIAYVEERHGEH